LTKKYYTKEIPEVEVTKAMNLRKFAEFAPLMTRRVLDDSNMEANSFSEAEQMGAPLIQVSITKANCATIRFIDYMSKLEEKYKTSKNDRIVDLEMCKSKDRIWGELKFLNEVEST